jgi:hypothetical protein
LPSKVGFVFVVIKVRELEGATGRKEFKRRKSDVSARASIFGPSTKPYHLCGPLARNEHEMKRKTTKI